MRLFRSNNQVSQRRESCSTARKLSATLSIFSALMAWWAAKDPVGICLYALHESLSDGLNPQSRNKTWIQEKVANCKNRENLSPLESEFFIMFFAMSAASLALYLVLRCLSSCQATNRATLFSGNHNVGTTGSRAFLRDDVRLSAG